jgi:hypothetical protein
MDPGESVERLQASAQIIAAGNVWAHMAEVLVTTSGHQILEPSIRGQTEDGLALVTWTEAHFMPTDEYHRFVAEARKRAGLGSSSSGLP